jgi:hypothetical protein
MRISTLPCSFSGRRGRRRRRRRRRRTAASRATAPGR